MMSMNCMMVILAGVVCCFETEGMDKHMSCSLGLAAVCMDKEREGDGHAWAKPKQRRRWRRMVG